MDYAKITLIGHVGFDPRSPIADKPDFVTFSVAVGKDYVKNNEKVSTTTWYECVTSRSNLSQITKNYVKKGSKVYIEGSPVFTTYETQAKEIKVKIQVNIVTLILLGSKTQEGVNSDNINNYSATESGMNHLDDEIPF